MINAEAPFPHVGSFALLVDRNLPPAQQRAELVRVMRHGAGVAVSFPLRTGASGNRMVAPEDLIDGTPLTKAEERELHDLQRQLAGRVGASGTVGEDGRSTRTRAARPIKASASAEALQKRLIYSDLLRIERGKLARLDARAQLSTGRYLPRGEHSLAAAR